MPLIYNGLNFEGTYELANFSSTVYKANTEAPITVAAYRMSVMRCR